MARPSNLNLVGQILLICITAVTFAAYCHGLSCSVGDVDAMRFDCYPEADPNQQKCEARGCCWKGQPTVTSTVM